MPFHSLIVKSMKPIRGIFIAIILLVFTISVVRAEGNKRLDSLLIDLQKPQHDTLKFELLIEIGDYYSINEPETAKVYFIKARELADKNLENPGLLERKFLIQKAKAIRYLAYVYLNQDDFKTALEKYFEALEIGESIHSNEIIYNAYNNIGIINHLRKEYGVAAEYYNKAIEITEKSGNKTGRAKLYINMGVLNYDLGNSTDSINQRLKYFQQALDNFTIALKLKKELNDAWGQSLCYTNLGDLKRDGAKLIEDEDLKKNMLFQSGNFYRQSMQISNEMNDQMLLSKTYGNLANLQLVMRSLKNIDIAEKKAYTDSALFFGTESYKLALALNSKSQQKDASQLLKDIYSLIGDTRKALEYANINIKVSGELFSEDKTKSLNEMRIRYETEKKDNEIKILSTENELKEIRIKNAKRERFFYITIALSFLALSVLLLNLYFNRKRTAKLLEGKNEELKVLNSTKDKFISILAHDLKNPLAAFLNITSALDDGFDEIDDNNKKKYIKKLHQSVVQLNSLLKNMLEWAVIKHKSTVTSVEKLNLYEIVEYVYQTLSDFASEHLLKIENTISGEIHVCANRAYLIAILNNLVTNAIKFSVPGKKISISANINSNLATVFVEDNGIGIAPGDIDKLFRIDIDTHTIGQSEGKGTGMGLILCKELIEKMNGRIWVESKLGEGTRFIFTLPLGSGCNMGTA
jgi:signal transduction histidine kinase